MPCSCQFLKGIFPHPMLSLCHKGESRILPMFPTSKILQNSAQICIKPFQKGFRLKDLSIDKMVGAYALAVCWAHRGLPVGFLLPWLSVLLLLNPYLCFCASVYCALWSPAGKGLTSWLSFVMSNCEFVTFPLVSWVRWGTWLRPLQLINDFLSQVMGDLS